MMPRSIERGLRVFDGVDPKALDAALMKEGWTGALYFAHTYAGICIAC